jgi:hypothetical protein
MSKRGPRGASPHSPTTNEQYFVVPWHVKVHLGVLCQTPTTYASVKITINCLVHRRQKLVRYEALVICVDIIKSLERV